MLGNAKDVARRIQACKLLPIEMAQESNTIPEFFELGAQTFVIVFANDVAVLSGQREAGVRHPLQDMRKGIKEDVEPLLLGESAGKPNERSLQCVLLAKVSHIRRIRGGYRHWGTNNHSFVKIVGKEI